MNIKYTKINTNECRHSKMGPVRPNPIQRTVKLLMTVHNFSRQYMQHRTVLIVSPLTSR